jgi:hypothetical protein
MKQENIFYNNKRLLYYFLVRQKLVLKYLFLKRTEVKFLFILSPPYCGSTLLNQLLSTSKNVSSNNNLGTREGQLLPEVREFMFQKDRWNKNVKYPWKDIKKVWMKYWDQTKPVLLDKSIPNIMRVKEIKKEFTNLYFICMVRNPYAQVEGIIRRNNATLEYAADFAINCLRYQKENIEQENNLLFFSYEQLCEDKEKTIKRIIDFLSELNDINGNTLFKAHNFKTTESMAITNLNDEKIAKLSSKQLSVINSIFKKDIELLSYFNYSIIEGS